MPLRVPQRVLSAILLAAAARETALAKKKPKPAPPPKPVPAILTTGNLSDIESLSAQLHLGKTPPAFQDSSGDEKRSWGRRLRLQLADARWRELAVLTNPGPDDKQERQEIERECELQALINAQKPLSTQRSKERDQLRVARYAWALKGQEPRWAELSQKLQHGKLDELEQKERELIALRCELQARKDLRKQGKVYDAPDPAMQTRFDDLTQEIQRLTQARQ